MKYILLLFLQHIKRFISYLANNMITKWLLMVFEKSTLHSCQILTLYNTFIMPEAHKFEKNKTGTTDTDYEHLDRKKQEIPSDS